MATTAVKQSETTNEAQVVRVGRAGVEVTVAGKTSVLAWSRLRDAAGQDDAELAAIYTAVLRAAEQEWHRAAVAEAWRKARACAGHSALRTITRCFSGPVARGEDQNPAAHGNICDEEMCRCGARRKVLINGRHTETGDWGVDEAAVESAP